MFSLVEYIFTLLGRIVFIGKLICFHGMELRFHFRENKIFHIKMYLFVLTQTMFLILEKIVLQVKFCVSTSRKNIFPLVEKYISTTGKNSIHSKVNIFILFVVMFPMLGKLVLRVKIFVSTSVKYVSNTRKNIVTGRLMCLV